MVPATLITAMTKVVRPKTTALFQLLFENVVAEQANIVKTLPQSLEHVCSLALMPSGVVTGSFKDCEDAKDAGQEILC